MELSDLAVQLAETESQVKSNTTRLGKLETQTEVINRLATSIEVMVVKQDNMTDQLTEVVSDVKDLKAEPGNRWRFVAEKALYVAVAAVLGFIFARIGLA